MLPTRRNGGSVVGLDVDAGSVAAVEVQANGSLKVARTGIAPLGPGAVREGEVKDADALADALRDLFSSHKLSKSVRVGIANQRIAMRTLQLPMIDDPEELDTAVRFQAQEHIPMPIEQAVVDYQVVGGQEEDGVRTMNVVVAAARRDMVSAVMDALRSAGLRPVGIDLSAFGLIRALAEESAPVTVYFNLGDVTNFAVAQGGTCLFTRIVPFGMEAITSRLAERREMALDRARDLVAQVGLTKPLEDVEGDAETAAAVREALEEGSSKLADELRLSLEFYAAQDGAPKIERAVVSGAGSLVEGLPERLGQRLALPTSSARPAALEHLGPAEAARLTLGYGLALDRLAATGNGAQEAG